MNSQDHKVLNRYALNDVAHWAQWVEDDDKITISARYGGYDAQGNIYFKVLRFRRAYSKTSIPMHVAAITSAAAPQGMDLRIAAIEPDIAVASWRSGPGADDVTCAYYAIGKQGELLEVEHNERSTESRPIGFHQVIEKQ